MPDMIERQRRQRLVAAHMQFENDHDIENVMGTFAPDATMIFNGGTFGTPDAIRAGHQMFGFSPEPGALDGVRGEVVREHITHDEVVIEGLVHGTHVRPLLGFAGTGAAVVMPYVAFYRFDGTGKLINERVTMNFAPINPPAAAPGGNQP